TVLTARNCGSLTPTLPPPVTWRSCTPAPAAAVKQPSPSETTVNGRASDLAANLSTASLVNEHCTKHARTGCPASVVCTAAMKGTLFSQPRPALPPESSPPRYASSISTRPLELASVLAHTHDLHYLVLEQPGRFVRHAQLAAQFEGGYVVLRLGQQVHGQEPARQRQLGRLEDRAADDAALVAARGALPIQPSLAPERAARRAAAHRADKALRPTRGNQCVLAAILGPVVLQKLTH